MSRVRQLSSFKNTVRTLENPLNSESSAKQVDAKMLRFDINTLLSLFNEMENSNSGEVNKKGATKIMEAIGLYYHSHLLTQQFYTFDHFLSILGEIEVPTQSSIYVLSFVKILARYRDKCLLKGDQGLQEAREVQGRLQNICKKEMQRQKLRIRSQHSKIYDQMQKSQDKQFRSFQEEWNNYLQEFRVQTSRRLKDTKQQKKQQLMEQENKFVQKMRKTSVNMSPRLRELMQRKRWLIHERQFDKAIEVAKSINEERYKLQQNRQTANQHILHKKLQKLASNTNRYLGTVEHNLQVNMNRLIGKKRQGESIMRIRMKKLRQQAHRKLDDHFRSEINRLRSSFYMAANS